MVNKPELITLMMIGRRLWLLVKFTAVKVWHAAVIFAAGLLPRGHGRRVQRHRPGDPFPRNVRALTPGASTNAAPAREKEKPRS